MSTTIALRRHEERSCADDRLLSAGNAAATNSRGHTAWPIGPLRLSKWRDSFSTGRRACCHRSLLLVLLFPSLTGCALHYYDARSGTEHLWGFGHMKMKAAPPNEGTRAVVVGTQTLGAGLRLGQEDYSIALGWDSHRKIVVGEDTAVRLEWPDGDFFNVRVGTKPPAQMQATGPKPKLP